jgi:hypothetical protein
MPCTDHRREWEESEALKLHELGISEAESAACELYSVLSPQSIRKLSGKTQLWIAAHRRQDFLRGKNCYEAAKP